MEDKQKIYLDKVVEFLIRDTIIDYDLGRISFPFGTRQFRSISNPFPSYGTPMWNFKSYFYDHCKNVYGLTDDEIKYVWNKFEGKIFKMVGIK